MRFRFSLRTLFLAVTLFALVLGLSLRFGPHWYWRTVRANVALGKDPIPNKTLVPPQIDEPMVLCRLGPVSWEMPETLSRHFEINKGMRYYITFQDNNRPFTIMLPDRAWGALTPDQRRAFPEKEDLTFTQLFREICNAQSSDFSYGMSLKDLRWHQLLLAYRSLVSFESVEFLWRDDWEGSFGQMNSVRVFQWHTTDGKWEGIFHFSRDPSPTGEDWMRHVCATFAIEGDLSAFEGMDENSLRAMLQITPVE